SCIVQRCHNSLSCARCRNKQVPSTAVFAPLRRKLLKHLSLVRKWTNIQKMRRDPRRRSSRCLSTPCTSTGYRVVKTPGVAGGLVIREFVGRPVRLKRGVKVVHQRWSRFSRYSDVPFEPVDKRCPAQVGTRSEERRVGKECRSGM